MQERERIDIRVYFDGVELKTDPDVAEAHNDQDVRWYSDDNSIAGIWIDFKTPAPLVPPHLTIPNPSTGKTAKVKDLNPNLTGHSNKYKYDITALRNGEFTEVDPELLIEPEP